MPTFAERLHNDYTTALKAHDELVVGTVRLLQTALKNEEIAGKRKKLTDDDVMNVVRREIKRRKEAVELYRKGNSPERADREQAELGVLERYMPEQMDAAAVDAIVAAVIEEAKPSGPADFGRVMGLAMKQLKGKADGAVVQAAIKQALAKITP